MSARSNSNFKQREDMRSCSRDAMRPRFCISFTLLLTMGLTLIIGGALGNMLDRARIGSVIDFVHVSYKAWSFAVFNFADAAITMGVIATIASTYLETPRVSEG